MLNSCIHNHPSHTSPAFAMNDCNMGAIWSTVLWQNNNVVTTLPTMLSNLTIWLKILWQYCSPHCQFWQYGYHIWKQYCFTIWWEYSTILSQYCQFSQYCIIILLSYMVTILSNLTTLLTILLQCIDHCCVQFRRSLLMYIWRRMKLRTFV